MLRHAVIPARGQHWSAREWLMTGAAAWMAMTLLYVVVIGLRRMNVGLPFADGWPQVGLTVATLLIAALLCPLVVLAVRQVRRVSLPAPLRITTYVLLGIAYWVGWAALVALLFPSEGATLVGSWHFLPRDTSEPLLPFPPADATWVEAVSGTMVRGALIILTVHAVVVTVFEALWNLDQARKAEAKAVAMQAELVATEAAERKARLNPGLVFESLDTASHLMGVDERAARRVLADLSELLRVSLGREGVQLIRLKDELHLLLRYLRIRLAHIRATPKLELRIPRAAEVWPVPPLVLMSLLDEVLRSVEDGDGRPIRFAVSATEAQGAGGLRLFLELCGLERTERPPVATGGGIADALIRLRAAYGADATVEVVPGPDGGIRIEVALPAHAQTNIHLHPMSHAR